MSHPAFLALAPDAALHRTVQDAKNTVLRLAGPQRYLSDPPHLTLFVGSFADLDAAGGVIAAAARSWRRPTVTVAGWHVFRDDPITGGHTLVCQIVADTMAALRTVQAAALAAADPLRDLPASMARYAAARPRLTPLRLASLDRYGFPFTGADWHPHVSVASIDPGAWDAVWLAVKDHAPQGAVSFPSLRWYRLVDERPELLREIALP